MYPLASEQELPLMAEFYQTTTWWTIWDMLWWMASAAEKDMSFVFQLDQLSFTHGPTSDNGLTAPEINPAWEARLLQKILLIIHMLPFD